VPEDSDIRTVTPAVFDGDPALVCNCTLIGGEITCPACALEGWVMNLSNGEATGTFVSAKVVDPVTPIADATTE
jgi:hypothetical protein